MTEMNATPTGSNEVRPSEAAKSAYAAVVLKPTDDAVSVHAALAEKQVVREQGPDAGSIDLGLIARGTGAWTELTESTAKIAADELLSPAGKSAAIDEPLAKAADEIRSMKSHAADLEANANGLEKAVVDEELFSHLDRSELIAFTNTLAGMDEGWVTKEYLRVTARHPKTWSERDAKIAAAVLLSTDIHPKPLLSDFARNEGFTAFVKNSPRAAAIQASRNRAELIRRVAGTVESSTSQLAEKRGLGEKWSALMGGKNDVKLTGTSPERKRWTR